jgi:hypothetical protein
MLAPTMTQSSTLFMRSLRLQSAMNGFARPLLPFTGLMGHDQVQITVYSKLGFPFSAIVVVWTSLSISQLVHSCIL